MPVTGTDRLYAIVEQGLCIGCGICQAIAPSSIAVSKTPEGNLRPVVIGHLSNETVDKIYDVCPGTRIDGMPELLIDRETRIDNVWGPWRRIVRAWAADPKVRFEGSTGGVLTALGQYLLRSKRVSFILHTKASTTEPTFGEPTLSFTEAEVFDAAGSRYGPTATLLDIRSVLDRREPFAFIAKPCDIAALRSFARHDPRVNDLVKYWLTPVCGGIGPPEVTSAFIRRAGLNPDELTAFRYRGRGCPGPTVAETETKKVQWHYNDYWGDDGSWTLPWRCKICPDGTGESADIVATDTWPGGTPRRDETDSDPGTNAVVARTATGLELLEAAARDNAITIEHDITPDELSHYQMHHLRKKYAAAPRFQALADEGRIVPITNRLRLEDLADELPNAANDYQRSGTRDRVRIGKATEPTPVADSP